MLWNAYLEKGPGNLNPAHLAAIEAAAQPLLPLHDEQLRTAVDTIMDLSRRCVTTPQGLCFVTGEAGLLPRADLHAQFESCLSTIESRIRSES